MPKNQEIIMTTLPPPATKQFPDDSLERKVYDLVDSLSEFLPVVNDRNRLAFSLYKYLSGEGDQPSVLVKTAKIEIVGISPEELTDRLDNGIAEIKESEKNL